MRALEVCEATIDGFFDFLFHHAVVGLVVFEVAEGILWLTCIPEGVASKRRYLGRCLPDLNVVLLTPSFEG